MWYIIANEITSNIDQTTLRQVEFVEEFLIAYLFSCKTKTNGLIHVQNIKRKTEIQQQTTSTETQTPSQRQAHTECGRFNHVCRRQTLPLTLDSGVTIIQHKNKL